MALSDGFVRALGTGVALALTPLVVRALSRLAPPRRTLLGEAEQLKNKYGTLDTASHLASFFAVGGAVAVIVKLRLNSPWALGLAIGAPVGAYVGLMAIGTLSSPRGGWREFWRYQELKNKVGQGYLLPVYAGLIGLGVVSAVKLFW